MRPKLASKLGCVYYIVNRRNGKGYVGISTKGTQMRFKEHIWASRRSAVTALEHAIRKYGDDAFAVFTLEEGLPWDELCALEKLYIRDLGSKAPFGYNATDGGEGIVGLKHTAEHNRRISLGKTGKPFSADHCRNLALAHQGKKPSWEWTPERRAALSAKARKIAANSEERARRSARAKAQHAAGRLGRRCWGEAAEKSFREKITGRPRASYKPETRF